MRITKIAVKGLFGMFDHEIPLNQDERITIVHGPNGVGKTVLLQLVTNLFQCEYENVGKISFERLRIEFENCDFITVKNFREAQSLVIHYEEESDSIHLPFRPRTFVTDKMGHDSTQLIPEGEFSPTVDGIPRWKSGEHHDVLTQKDLLQKYPDVHRLVYGDAPGWFVNIQKQVKVDLIKTERLRRDLVDDEELMWKILNWDLIDDDELRSSTRAAVDVIWDEFRTSGKFSLDDHIEAINEMKLKYPNLWPLPSVEFLEELELDDYGSTMMRVGQLSEDAREEFFRLFVETMEDLRCQKEALLENIIKHRFISKSLTVRDRRFRICTDDGCEIPASALSSGEQHLLVLYSKLLLQVPSASLLMIDEPELSLHVDWQEFFLNDVQRIVELRNIDLLFATHSPTLVDDKWEWTVGLRYPESEPTE